MPLVFRPLISRAAAWSALAVLLLPTHVLGRPAMDPAGDDVAALEQLVSDYALGFHIGDADLVMRSVHRDLSKRGVDRNFRGLGVQTVTWLEGESLRQMGLNYDRAGQFDETTQRRAIILDVSDDVAVVEVLAGNWYDAFTAVKIDGRWTLLDCVWGGLTEWEPADVDDGEAAVVNTILAAFSDAIQNGEDAELDRVLNPISQFRSLSYRDGRAVLHAQTRDQIYSADHAGRDPGALGLEVQVLNASGVTAVGKVIRGRITYWVQLLRTNESWSIVNVLWRAQDH